MKNVDGVVPTNAWMPYQTTTVSASGAVTTDALAADQPLFEYGGGDLTVTAGRDINGGVYYVEKGDGTLTAGNTITTNATRTALGTAVPTSTAPATYSTNPADWLPTTLFLGKGSFDLSARGDILLGATVNPFLLPQGMNNSYLDRAYFSTYAPDDAVDVTSLTGSVTLKDQTSENGASFLPAGTLAAWFDTVLGYSSGNSVSSARPWLRLTEAAQGGSNAHLFGDKFQTALSLLPPALRATAFAGDIDLQGTFLPAPSPTGTLDLEAAGSINGLQLVGPGNAVAQLFQLASIDLSDADPAAMPSIYAPFPITYGTSVPAYGSLPSLTANFAALNSLFAETGATLGVNTNQSVQDALHDPDLLHAGDPTPAYIYAGSGDISGLQLFMPKQTQIIAGSDIQNIAFYLQNDNAADVSMVIAGRDIIPYDEQSAARLALGSGSNTLTATFWPGDISIGGLGTLEVLAGRDLSLGAASSNSSYASSGLSLGIVSIGNQRNPYLPSGEGASIIGGAGMDVAVGGPTGGAGLPGSGADFAAFIAGFLDPATAGAEADRYLPDLAAILGMTGASNQDVWTAFSSLPATQQDIAALNIFYLVLRDAGRDHNDGLSPGFGVYTAGFQAIADLFPGNAWQGDISLTAREIKTANGGDIDLLVPGGQLLVGFDLGSKQPLDQGIMTLEGGNISIFARDNVTVGTSRIFTFQGGNEIIWSTDGNIAAGSASKTLQAAPPARYLVNPETGASILDLAGLAMGGGIGVLQTLKGVPPGDVDLIAPSGIVDAGEAGIRASGNLNVAALQVLNAWNIDVGGKATGVPVAAAPNLDVLTTAANTAGQAADAANQAASQTRNRPAVQDLPSIITVEVIGYGGYNGDQPQDGKKLQQDQHRKTGTQQSYNLLI